MKHIFCILSTLVLLSACSDDVDRFSKISDEQKSLIGRAVESRTSVDNMQKICFIVNYNREYQQMG